MRSMDIPEIGTFYYHFKHHPAGPVEEFAYLVVDIAFHTEIDNLEESRMVIYRPVYRSPGANWEGKQRSLARPYAMFMDHVERGGYSGPRFNPITDILIIQELNEKYRLIYNT
jgi:hypothetical protein